MPMVEEMEECCSLLYQNARSDRVNDVAAPQHQHTTNTNTNTNTKHPDPHQKRSNGNYRRLWQW